LQRLNLKYDELLSNFAFNFYLRRYSKVVLSADDRMFDTNPSTFIEFLKSAGKLPRSSVGRCRLTPG
jgi:hypothetical protein